MSTSNVHERFRDMVLANYTAAMLAAYGDLIDNAMLPADPKGVIQLDDNVAALKVAAAAQYYRNHS